MRLQLQFCVMMLLLAPVQLAGRAISAELRDLNSHCPFTPPESLEEWQARAEELRLQLQVALGLHPPLQLDAVQANIYGPVERDDYTIEKVTFESLPGFYVTGNLYRPRNLPADQRVPAVLAPHGHWDNARFYDADPAAVKKLLADGSERFENAARNHIQARCVQLARMGCVVFHWDMIGYCDSQQINSQRAHRFGKQPPSEEVTADGWLLFSPRAEAYGQSILGMQTLAIHRAVDMLLALPEVDPQRIAISGASGGGTQSFLGAAVDPRISVAFPAVMVSTGMQGGCTCENACWLRTGTGNVEMAGLIAPRPLGMTAADDWTRTMPEDGFPQLQQLYALYDARPNVALFPALHFGHNFNHVSRVALYGWINDHFGLKLEKPILERDFELAGREELSVWDAQHPQPESGEAFERKLMKTWAELLDRQLTNQLQGDASQLDELARTLKDGWRVCLGLTTGPLAPAELEGDLQQANLHSGDLPDWQLTRRASAGKDAASAEDPSAPTAADPPAADPVAADPVAADPVADQDASHAAVMSAWSPAVDPLEIEVAGGDGLVVYQLTLAGQNSGEQPQQVRLQALVENPRLAAAYTFGYNLPLFVQRAQQLGLSLQLLSQRHPGAQLTVTGAGEQAALAAAGAFVAQQLSVADQPLPLQLNLTPGAFAFADVASIRHPGFVPSAARYGDLPGLVACIPASIHLAGGDEHKLAAYRRLAPLAAHSGSQWVLP